jgi:rhodanese-related sulfurtransferase
MRPRIISSLFVFLLSPWYVCKRCRCCDNRCQNRSLNGIQAILKSAIHIPLDTIEKNIILTELDKNKEIYLYCRSGNRSGKATRILQNLGYRNVTNIGGIQSASINLNIPIVTK